MRKRFFTYLFVAFALILTAYGCTNAQGGGQLLRAKCPNSSSYQSFQLLANGSQAATTCAGGSFTINGATIAGVSGGTNEFIPRYTGATTLGVTPFSWNSTTYAFNNTALNADFLLSFTPTTTTLGSFVLGDGITGFEIYRGGAGFSNSTSTYSANEIVIGDITNAQNGSTLTYNDFNERLTFTNGGASAIFDLAASRSTFNTLETRVRSAFQVSTLSDCGGQASLDGAGTLTLNLTNCTINDANALVMATYNNTAVAKVLPLSATRASATQLTFRGDANAGFSYWIVDRY
jgi:hypothetical protein